MSRSALGGDVLGVLAGTILLIVVALFVDDGTFAWLVTPFVLAGVAYMMFRAPIRHALVGLMFCAFTFENPIDRPALPLPGSILGYIMLAHLNNVTGISGLSFSGMDLCLLMLGFRAYQERAKALRVTPRPLIKLAQVSLLGTLYVWVNGLLRGGDFAYTLWQIDKVLYLPIVFLIAQVGIRGVKDAPLLGRTVVFGAMYKAIMAVIISMNVPQKYDWWGNPVEAGVATGHHDSVLFANAFVLILSLVATRMDRKAVRIALMVLPVLASGMIANNRRMVWVQIGLVFLTIFFTTPSSPAKKKAWRALAMASPFIALYIAAGWNNTGLPIFKPVKTIRSVVDSQSDPSSITRDIENYDLLFTLKLAPILGRGYGNGYIQVIPLPEMGYPLEPYCPHNSILGLWVFGGFVGYTAMTLLWAAGVYFGMRAYSLAKKGSRERATSIMTVGAVLIYAIQCYGDVGLGSWIGVFTVGPAIAMAGKLCVHLGGWELPSKRRSGNKAKIRDPVRPAAVA